MKRRIERVDILPIAEFARLRRERRNELVSVKRNRRMEVGPYATFYFENYDTMWWQVHEMLFIERGGEEQIADELAAYNPLIPQGQELVATLMFEIDDPARRNHELGRLGGVEETVALQIQSDRIAAIPESDTERTTGAGKTSSVHFLRFPFTPAQMASFREPTVPVMLGINHAEYGHMAALPAAVRDALAKDFA